jgi:hypothetical protein
VRNEPWAPPRIWTAWPLPTHLLPPDDFMKRTEDEDEVFTFRRPEAQTPSSLLEEVVSAATLKFAKERFLSRDATEPARRGDDRTPNAELLSSGNDSQPSESGDEGEGDEMIDVDQEPEGRRKGRQKAPAETFKPVVSTDDDVSYDLIRPSTRRILENLDRTLSILHNTRMTSAQYLEDSGESSSENEEERDDYGTPQRRSESRQSSQPASSPGRSPSKPSRMPAGDAADESPTKKSGRGRPRKYVQMEGESERDFEIRRARALKGKMRIPPPQKDDDDDEDGTAGESQGSPRKRTSPRKRRRGTSTEDRGYWMQKQLSRSKLRDWRDVMGAAALAGFPPSVVARATQRCADLFGQGMEMHKVYETAESSGASRVKTTTYRPGGEMPASSSSEADEDVGGLDVRQARSMRRHSSAAQRRTGSPESGEVDAGEEAATPKKTQKRATARGKKGQHYCPYPSCERAHSGFDRPFNLKRHMKLVHGQDGLEVAEDEGAAPADDMLGGVRRDGFLEPIRVQKGWRAEDTKKRAARNP